MQESILRVTSILSILLLTACASSIIDETIPLTKSFEESSELITYKKSNWKIGGKSFNQPLRNYSVENSKVRWKKSRENLAEREVETNFINYLLFDDELTYITEKFNVDETQQYSFNLMQGEELVSNSKCEIFSHSIAEKVISEDNYDSSEYETSSIKNRQDTFVFCIVEHNGKLWELSLSALLDEPLEVQLETDDQFYEVLDVSDQLLLKQGDNGIEKIKSPSWLAKNSGLEFYRQSNKVSALSFVGKPKMWLQEDLSDEQKELLLTVNYSLSMFNWLDDQWREQPSL